MLKDEWVAAATALRSGFAANSYIAEILGGNPNPVPLAIFHGTNFSEPEVACDYIQKYGTLWHMQPDSLRFTRWLFNHPKVMVERAAIMECQEALLWASDASIRSKIVEQKIRLTAGIDETISTAIVTKRKDRRGQMVWPWTQI